MLGTVLLYEMLARRGLRPELTQGYFIGDEGGLAFTAWHVWVTVDGRIYDTGREILLAASGNSAAALRMAISAKAARYSLAPLPGVVRADLESEEGRAGFKQNQQFWAALRPEALQETFWATAPPPVLQLRDEANAQFAARELKPPRKAGFGKAR